MLRESILLATTALGLLAGNVAQARQSDLNELPAAGLQMASPLDAVWSAMEVQADSVWSDLKPEIDKERSRLFAPTGPADRDWAKHGVDMAALLAKAPGGAAANVLYNDSPEGPSIHALDASVLQRLASEWRPLADRGFAKADGMRFATALAVTPAHLLVSQEAVEALGNGFCPASGASAPADQMTLYRDAKQPYDETSEQDGAVEGAAFSTWTALSRTETPRLCWIYVEVAPGLYESRTYDREGRPLGHMDRGTRQLHIVPVADLRSMLTARVQPVPPVQESASAH